MILLGVSLQGCGPDAEPANTGEPDAPGLMFGMSHATPWNLDSLYEWDTSLTEARRLEMLGSDLTELGVGWYRPNLNWREVQPVSGGQSASGGGSTDGEIQAAADGTPGSGFDWTVFDRLFDGLEGVGIEVLPVLGNSDDWRLPRLTALDAAAANPDAMGQDAYLSALTLYARAAVRRYKSRIHIWQIENELNVAEFTRFVETGRKGNAWEDKSFLLRILETLSLAVKAEDSQAIVITNFHTDLPLALHDWQDTLLRWEQHLDWIGLDAYPNYVSGSPIHPDEVSRVVAEAKELVADDKPVLVLETGYPSAPTDKAFSEQSQAQYVGAAARLAIEAGASGFFVYTFTSPERSDAFGSEFQAAENYWGFVRRDGTRKPVFAAYHDAIGEIEGATAESND